MNPISIEMQAETSDLQTLLGEMPKHRFVTEFYQRLPYSTAGHAKPFCPLGDWAALIGVLAAEEADTLVCRQNELFPGDRPRGDGAARNLLEQGYTLLVRHAEQHDSRLAQVAAAFEQDFAAAVNIHMYCTPSEQFGFGWHYDAEEVFIIQTVGRKQYSLRKNTVNPWPLEETLPANMKYEREIMPIMRTELQAGDWLYIPAGYWHKGESRELSISLAIGVEASTAIDIFDFLRPHLVESLFWRQRLPVLGAASNRNQTEQHAELARLFCDLAAELQKELTKPKRIEQFMNDQFRSPAERSPNS
jgi:50S ribosomal protein L16 3-hydroxylase